MNIGRKQPVKRRGASLVLVAISLTMMGAVGALAIDLAMLYRAQADAERAAEAAALAGASAFVDMAAVDPSVADSADARARRFAEVHSILTQAIARSEDSVQVFPDSQKVRVWVRRQKVGTWFARFLGEDSVPISGRAAAEATHAGAGNCVKPFAVPDIWDDRTGEDANGNRVEDNTEQWAYTPNQDFYEPGNPDSPLTGTGYGSGFRTTDYGRLISLKLPDGVTPITGPGQFLPFSSTGSADPGEYRHAIAACDPNQVDLGTPYDLINYSPEIPTVTKAGIDSLIAADPGAGWDGQTIAGSAFADWRASPRTIRMGLFDPSQLVPGQGQVTFNNLGLMFLEGFDAGVLSGRFFYFAPGEGDPDPNSDPLAAKLSKRVRLVE